MIAHKYLYPPDIIPWDNNLHISHTQGEPIHRVIHDWVTEDGELDPFNVSWLGQFSPVGSNPHPINWPKIKSRIYRRNLGLCQVCKSFIDLSRRKRRLRSLAIHRHDPDNAKDLRLLCSMCHDRYHILLRELTHQADPRVSSKAQRDYAWNLLIIERSPKGRPERSHA